MIVSSDLGATSLSNAYTYQDEPGGLRFRRLFNYRRVGGILFFDQENLGLEGAGLGVDAITPQYVEDALRPISTVTLEDVRVEPLVDDAG